MVYKRFSVLVIIRIGLILMNMIIIARTMIIPNKIFTSLVLILILIGQIYELLFYVNKTNRTLSYFLDAIKDKDFSVSTNIEVVDKSFKSLNESFKNITKTILDSKIEKEAQFHLLNLIIENVNSGIILFDHNENISLINHYFIDYFKLSTYKTLEDLINQIPGFYNQLNSEKIPFKKLAEAQIEDENKQFLMYVNTVKLIRNNYTLITFQDIKQELEFKEIQSWQKLLRTLGHEIMNSVTPISSLAETSLLQIQNSEGKLKKISEIEPLALEKIQKALVTIEKRSSSLYYFVNDFRKLAKIPEPVKENFLVCDLFESVKQLVKSEFEKKSISLDVEIYSENLNLNADFSLIEQVLINLLLNSKEAVDSIQKPHVKLTAQKSANSTILKVIDNGVGISGNQLEKIFIPFFTTKEKGSGIGLSLSRQIMHLHGGNISVKSEPNIETIFTLQF